MKSSMVNPTTGGVALEFKNGDTHTILERERMRLKTVTLAPVLQSAS